MWDCTLTFLNLHSRHHHHLPTCLVSCVTCRDGTKLIGPPDVAAALQALNKTVYAGTTVLTNGQSSTLEDFEVHAVCCMATVAMATVAMATVELVVGI